MSISVVIIEDQREIREMLAIIIKGYSEFSLLGCFENASTAMEKIPGLNPDVALVDIHLPDLSGIECLEYLKSKCPNTQFIMCTSLEDGETIFAALKAGANGYLSKTTAPSKILEAIIEVKNGGSPMSSHIARKVVNSFSSTQVYNELNKLSSREKEILDLLAKGYRYKEIADQLFLSLETIRTHIRNIYEKLQVNSRMMAINKAYGKK